MTKIINLGYNICKCNNCDELFYDTNPQVDAPEFMVNELRTLIDNKCPNCKTDDYLIDITDINQLAQNTKHNDI